MRRARDSSYLDRIDPLYIVETNSKSVNVIDSIRIVENFSDYDGSLEDGNGEKEAKGGALVERGKVGNVASQGGIPSRVASSRGDASEVVSSHEASSDQSATLQSQDTVPLQSNAASQNNAAFQNNTAPQNNAAPQNNTASQNNAASQNNTAPQINTAPQNNAAPQNNTASQNNTAPRKRPTFGRRVRKPDPTSPPIPTFSLEEKYPFVLDYHHNHTNVPDKMIRERFSFLQQTAAELNAPPDDDTRFIVYFPSKAGLGNTLAAWGEALLLAMASKRHFRRARFSPPPP